MGSASLNTDLPAGGLICHNLIIDMVLAIPRSIDQLQRGDAEEEMTIKKFMRLSEIPQVP